MASNGCYGRTLAIDWLIGTDKGFRAYVARKKALIEKDTEKPVGKTEWNLENEIVIGIGKQEYQDYLFECVIKIGQCQNGMIKENDQS